MKKMIALFLSACLVVLALAGCQPASSSDPGPTGQQTSTGSTSSDSTKTEDLSETGTLNLVWVQGRGTDSLFENPWTDMQSLYPYMVFDALVRQVDSEVFVPKLAKDWKVSSDGLTYTFTLDETAKWHDGTPFTQEDVLFSCNARLKAPKSVKDIFTNVEGAAAVMEGTADTISGITAENGVVTIKLTIPDSFFLGKISYMMMLPKHLLEKADPLEIDNYEEYWKKPVGTGAYYIDEVSFPNYFTVVRNDDYFGASAGIRKAVFTSYATGGNESVIAAAVAGKVDYMFGNAVNDINMAKNLESQNPDMKMNMIPSSAGRTIWYNNNGSSDGKYVDAVQKPEVRQALGLLIDKETIASFYEGQASVMSASYINPLTAAYNDDIPLFERNVEKAKQMLTDAGFDFSSTLRMLYYYDDQTTADVMELLKQNFAEAGVKLEPFLAQGDLASIIYEQRNWELMYCACNNTDTINAYLYLAPGSVRDNIFGDDENRQKYQEAINAFNAAPDAAARQQILQELQIEGLKDAYATHVYVLNRIVLYNAKRLQLDQSIFTTDYEWSRDYHFENWKLI